MTWREIIYMINDELKLSSDDSTFTEDHIAFLIGKYRAFLLKQKYSDLKKPIPDSNYQTIYLNLESSNLYGDLMESGEYLRSTIKVPNMLGIGNYRVIPTEEYQGEIAYISKDRMKYVGYNKYLLNITYAAKSSDDYLYLKSYNPQFNYLSGVRLNGIFSDPKEASRYESNESLDNDYDFLDNNFPIEESLVPTLIELVVKELLGASYRPEDSENNASDDLANLASFLQRNVKSSLAKQLTD